MELAHPEYLVDCAWLRDHLNDPAVRILESTVHLRREGDQMIRISGRSEFETGHIPGAQFADLIEALSDTSNPLPFMLPSPEQFAREVGRLGVSNRHRVICYDRAHGTWATRLWWMFRAFGHDNVAVLNGGYRAWLAGGHPVETGTVPPSPAVFTPRLRPELVAGKREVLAAIEDGAVCTINALAPEVHRGETGTYARRGRIPNSVNVPAMSLVDPETCLLRPPEELKALFDAVGALSRERVILYCGGGIAATMDAFVLTLLGHDNVAVYDGSLTEWMADESLPVEVG
ncbi:MAG: sulfurtransferase [Chloroflexota bacterium]|nr:sulfurtransferase [Dehalococcoidia bacterium]MDW8253896.1 sulfurtransferase [Chloroflexota bacterium]